MFYDFSYRCLAHVFAAGDTARDVYSSLVQAPYHEERISVWTSSERRNRRMNGFVPDTRRYSENRESPGERDELKPTKWRKKRKKNEKNKRKQRSEERYGWRKSGSILWYWNSSQSFRVSGGSNRFIQTCILMESIGECPIDLWKNL